MSLVRFCLLSLLALTFSASAQTLYKWVGKDGKVHYSDQPPPKEIKKVEKPRLSNSTIETSGMSFEALEAAKNFPVTLYTTPECGPECATARELLSRRGIPFSESRVVTTNDGDTFKKALGTDKLLFPALVVGKSKQIGFEQDIWHELLDTAGYPRSAGPGATGGQSPGAAPGR
jgi:arsenate reductase-like glutaredoxin family protein